jgi:cytochrome c biogenesis protein CcdA
VTANRTGSTDAPGELAAGLIEDARKLVRLEIALAKQELRELAIRNGVAFGLFAFAALLVVLAVFVGIPVLIVELVPNHWLAALIWVVAYVVVALVMAFVGKLMLRIEPPPKTLSSLKETKEWALRQISSTGR